VAAKPDSQDICFVPDGRYAETVKRLRPEAARKGAIVHVDGRKVGVHDGVIHFTVGQRKGLGLGGEAEPLYVVRIEPETAQVVVGPKAALLEQSFALHGVNWLGDETALGEDGRRVMMKLRNTHTPIAGAVFGEADGGARVVLDQAEAAVTPGQACVFYDGARVLGGGWIARGGATRPISLNLKRAVAANP
jgi:tRNA-specific 2-thiouridylase